MLEIAGSSVCQTDADAQMVIQRLAHSSVRNAVYDVETSGLSWRTDQIVGHVVTFGPNPIDTFYIPTHHAGGGQHAGNIPGGDQFVKDLSHILATRSDLTLIGHNILFDCMMCHGAGMPIVCSLEDTQVNAAILDEFQGKYDLEFCCTCTGTTPKKGTVLYQHLATKFGGDAIKNQMGNFWRLLGNDPVGCEYATGDGVATWNLWQEQRRRIDAEGMSHIADLEAKITRVVYRMMRRGIRVDEGRLEDVIRNVDDRIVTALSRLPSDFKVRSPLAIRKLFEDHGVSDFLLTPASQQATRKWRESGQQLPMPRVNYTFDEAWLSQSELGRSIIAVRKFENLRDSFLIPLRDRHLYKGQVHSTFHQCRADDYGTMTYRFSSSNPNLQQVPKRNRELGELFRSVFVPGDGMIWWDADMSQAEPRILAHYTGARVLMNGYMQIPHIDAHSAVAEAAGIDRDSGKRVNQAIITGAGRNKIISMVGAHGAEVYDKYFEAMPEIKDFQKRAENKMVSRGYVISLLGRRARLESRDQAYKALNRLLQVGNADLMKQAMVRIDALYEANGDKVHLLNTVHDSLSAQAYPNDEPIVREAMRIFCDAGPDKTIPMRVPIGVDFRGGTDWADATWGDREYIQ